MDITWYGQNCFRIVERGETTVVTDPYGPELGLPELKLKTDVVTLSSEEIATPGALDAVKGSDFVLSGAGEYEVGGVFITGLPMHHVDEEAGIIRRNVVYLVEYPNGLTVLHLGNLSIIPDQSTIEELDEVNVVLVPVGGGDNLRASAAAEVIALIEPNYVVPMQYDLPDLKIELDPVEKFLKTMGVSKVQEEEYLRVSSTTLPEQPQVVILQPQLKA